MKSKKVDPKSDWNFLNAEGETARICRQIDWGQTSLGPISTWDRSLRAIVGTILRSSFPKFIAWGPERIMIYNDAYIEILGPLKHPKSIGARFRDVWLEVFKEIEPVVLAVENGHAKFFEDQRFNIDRTGQLTEAYFTFSYSPLLNDSEQVAGFLCTCVETTKSVLAKREMMRVQDDVVAILENMNDGFFCVDKNWIITRVNTNHEVSTERKREDQLGRNFLELYLSGDCKETIYYKSYQKAMNERVKVVFEDYYAPLKLWAECSLYPQPDGGLAVFFRDINEEKRIKAELVKAKEEAERANHLKSAFLANMSHEIRTPLGAMMGFADLLRDPSLSEMDRANYIDVLNRNGEQLGRIINDILDLSKVETGQISFEYLAVKPMQIVKEVAQLMSVLAAEKGLDLVVENSRDAPETLVTDPTRMKQVLMNLVSNALKFTRMGSVRISLSGFEASGGRGCAIEVTDTGEGIPEDAVDKLFKMFTQADNSMTRKYGGTGLGLALSRSLARALGGDVQMIRSKRHFGSVFRFTLSDRPADPNRAPVVKDAGGNVIEPPKPDVSIKGLRILLVEDSVDNQHLISRYLSRHGAKVDVAGNGDEGMTKALTYAHDLVLMDLQMPIMDGYTATDKLRARGYERPIVALTAHAMADVQKKCRAVGFTDHLPKPINPKDLLATIAQLTSLS